MEGKLYLLLIFELVIGVLGGVDFSWIGEVTKKDLNSEEHICYGSLIYPTWVISAASCFFDSDHHNLVHNISSLQIHFDEKLSSSIIQIIPYDFELVDQILYNDIALIQINSIGYKPVQLPQWYMNYDNEIAETFASKDPSDYKPFWEIIAVKIESNSHCEQYEVQIDLRKMCVNVQLNTSVARRGLPLFVVNVMETPIVVGVAGIDSKSDDQSSTSVFTRVSEYLGWIHNTIQ